jgi:hypothetical protein
MLAADGYELTTIRDDDGSPLILDVRATTDACAECLAPPNTIALVARDCLVESDPALAQIEIDVRLPSSESSDNQPTG